MKHIAIYVRVSSKAQDVRSQLPDLERWAKVQDAPVVYYKDNASGRTMDRPGWRKLEAAMRQGQVLKLCVWRLDRLGRTVSGLSALFEELQLRKINLESLRDGLDLATPAGRLMANVLASVAAYETEVRGDRVRAGMAAAKAAGRPCGGSKPGVRKTVTPEKIQTILHLNSIKTPIARIARTVHLSRPSVYDVLRNEVP